MLEWLHENDTNIPWYWNYTKHIQECAKNISCMQAVIHGFAISRAPGVCNSGPWTLSTTYGVDSSLDVDHKPLGSDHGWSVWVAYVSHDLDFKDLFFSVMKNFRKPLITNSICFMCFLIKAIHLIWSNYLKKEKPSSSFLVLWLKIVSSSKLICFLCFP